MHLSVFTTFLPPDLGFAPPIFLTSLHQWKRKRHSLFLVPEAVPQYVGERRHLFQDGLNQQAIVRAQTPCPVVSSQHSEPVGRLQVCTEENNVTLYCIVLYLYIYIALLAVHTNQKRFQC